MDAKRAALAKSQVSSGLGQRVTFLKPVIMASSLRGSIPVNSSQTSGDTSSFEVMLSEVLRTARGLRWAKTLGGSAQGLLSFF